MAALILLAAMSIFVDFRVDGSQAVRMAEDLLRYKEAHGTTPIQRLEDAKAEIQELRVLVDQLLEERSLRAPNESLDNPNKPGAE